MDINSIASTTVVLGFVGGVFSFVILRPLNMAIDNLNKAIMELRTELMTAEERMHELEVKVAETDQRARSAHHRLDAINSKPWIHHEE
jgi:hypothetical protein